MGQMQWLGTIPKENASTYLAEALRQGIGGYTQGKQQAQQRTQQQQQYGLQKEELGIKKKAVEVDLEKIQYTKRKEMVDLLKDARDHVNDEQWQIIVNEPKTAELITSVYGDTGLNALRALQKKPTEWQPSSPEEAASAAGMKETEVMKSRLPYQTGLASWTPGKVAEAIASLFGKKPTTSKVPTKEYLGHTYEKREDGKWHLLK